ncbi:MAG: metallophosphoesterase [Bdellovibrionales bacterium]|nr:metallophosphoesterase [Bdellovibrionales bacterium]
MSNTYRLFVFVTIMATFSFLIVWWVGKRLIADTTWPEPTQRGVWIALATFFASMLIAPFLYRLTGRPNDSVLIRFTQWYSYIGMGFIAMLAFSALFRDLFLVVGTWAEKLLQSGPLDESKRDFLRNSTSVGAWALAWTGTSVGFYQALRKPQVKTVKIPFEALHKDLQGLTIAQISDVHVGPTIHLDTIEGLVRQLEEIQADILVFTGDAVDGTVDQLAQHFEPFKRLKPKHGKYYINGNHEYYWHAPSWMQFFKKELGFTVLENTHAIAPIGDAKLMVAGVNDLQASSFDPENATNPSRCLQGAPQTDFRVLLAHQPKTCRMTEGTEFHLQLSGHTHAGQFFPATIFIHLFEKYVSGLYQHGQMKIYVNAGTFYWGPPNRFMNPGEITLIQLTKS